MSSTKCLLWEKKHLFINLKLTKFQYQYFLSFFCTVKNRTNRSVYSCSSYHSFCFGLFWGQELLFWKKKEEIGCSQYRFDLLERDFDKFVDRRLMKWKVPDSNERKKMRKVITINFEKENVSKLWLGKSLGKEFWEEKWSSEELDIHKRDKIKGIAVNYHEA